MGIVDDLRYAQQVERHAEITTATGERIMACVREVNHHEDFVAVFAPEVFEDETTTLNIAIGAIVSVTVTDLAC
jgi:hypothetical protein